MPFQMRHMEYHIHMTKDRPDRHTLGALGSGHLIREARRLGGLTQAELARRLGTSQSAVSNWERGLDTPRVDTLARILEACGFEADLTFRRLDDVDRAQLRQNLARTPAARLESVRNVSRLRARARPVEAEVARA
jgi:transcriptional regulator with XRE-family HTH domain